MLRQALFSTFGVLTAQSLAGADVMFWPVKVQGFGGTVPVPVPLSQLKVGDPPLMVREGKFYISRLGEGLVALYWRCTHLCCTVPWNAAGDQFHCPCHGSIYERSGQNVAGPAPRPLDLMEVQVQGEQILVDSAKIRQRQRLLPEHAFPIPTTT